jgi:hypothetical protein
LEVIMKFHVPSFLLGFASGAGSAVLAPRLRKLTVELATTAFRLADGLSVRLARKREDLEDILAEARARARSASEPRPS